MLAGSSRRWTACLIVVLLSVAGLHYLHFEFGELVNEWSKVAKGYIQGQPGHRFDLTDDPAPTTAPYGDVVAAGSSSIDLSWMKQAEFQTK